MTLVKDFRHAARSLDQRLNAFRPVVSAKAAFDRVITALATRARIPARAALLALVIAAIYLFVAPTKYEAVMTIAPRESLAENQLKTSLGSALLGLSGLSNANPDFVQLTSAFYSFETARVLSQDSDVVGNVFRVTKSRDGTLRYAPSVTRAIKRFLLGIFGASISSTPTTDDMHRFIARHVHLSTDPLTGTAEITFKHRDPAFASTFLKRLFETSDDRLRQRRLSAYAENIKFLQKRLDQTVSTAHHNALVELLIEEDRKRLLTSFEMGFAADVIDPVHVSSEPASPKYLLVLFLSVVVGFLSGYVFQILRKNDQK